MAGTGWILVLLITLAGIQHTTSCVGRCITQHYDSTLPHVQCPCEVLECVCSLNNTKVSNSTTVLSIRYFSQEEIERISHLPNLQCLVITVRTLQPNSLKQFSETITDLGIYGQDVLMFEEVVASISQMKKLKSLTLNGLRNPLVLQPVVWNFPALQSLEILIFENMLFLTTAHAVNRFAINMANLTKLTMLTFQSSALFTPTVKQGDDVSPFKLRVFTSTTVKELGLRLMGIYLFEVEYFHAYSQLVNLTLEYNHLGSHIKEVVSSLQPLKNLSRLNLGYNDINYLPSNLSDIIPSLSNLSLVGNRLTQLDPAIFSKLKHIDISYNEFRGITDKIVDHLKNMTTFKFEGNTLICNCDIISFQEWLNVTSVSTSQNETCYNYANIKIRDYKPHWIYFCDNQITYVIIICSIGGACLLIVSIVIAGKAIKETCCF